MTANCRNNVGGGPSQAIAAPQGARGFAYYSVKDQAMVDAAEYGLMHWDGESKGRVLPLDRRFDSRTRLHYTVVHGPQE